ncbi:MAG: AmpG family muropeptide MFS transporter [Deltaproteobacteria bacterium]|nr:AmpG family muropeptide MFS transporter [Deltaproteobacteria bacterium]MBI3293609.1 AmpG family muropeptide MFS transporter [Deltaproteobacteria bacterium]
MAENKVSGWSVFTNRRIAVTLLLMFSSSFPLPLTGTGTTFQAWLKDSHVDIRTISLMSLVGLPYNFKFLWSPLLDRYHLPFLNRRTGWIALFQVLLIITIGSMGFINASEATGMVVFVAFMIAFFSASQDVVIDAYRIDILRAEERGAGASMVMIGGRLAFLTAGALALVLADHLPWHQVFMVMAACLLIGLLTSIFSPNPEVPVEEPKSLKQAVVEPFVSFFKTPGAGYVMAFLVTYKLADLLASALLTPFLLEVGFAKTDIGAVNKVFGMLSAMAGGLVCGAVIPKFGVYRSLWVFGLLQAASNFVFVGLALHGHSYPWMVAAIGVENFCGGMGTAALVAYIMSLCDRRFSATQFALLSSLTATARTVFASGTGFAANYLGWPKYFFFAALCAAPGLWLLSKLRNLDETPSTP